MINVIYDNVVFSLQKSGGISVYWKELLERIKSDNSVELKILEYPEADSNIFRKSLMFDLNQIEVLNLFPSVRIRRYFNPRVSVDISTIFHSSYYRTAKGSHIKNIVTVHDFTYEKKIRSLVGKIHIFQKRKALEIADGIICISENTKKDMLELYPYLMNKNIRVIYNGFNSFDYKHNENKMIENSVLFVGARKGYKNFGKAVLIVSELHDLSLTIVGPPLDSNEKTYLDRVLPNRYQSFSHVSNEELNELYNKSICLLYLSEYEGFGIPILEAMSAGCPVIALKKSSIPEVAGEAGLLFTSIDNKILQNTIESLRYNHTMRNEQIELGLRNAKRYSWDNCYKELLEFYQEVLDEA